MWDPYDDEPQDPRGFVQRLTVLTAAVVVALIVGIFAAGKAKAQDEHSGHIEGHAKYHAEYSHWCQPNHPDCMVTHNRSQSCCDARVVVPQGGGKEPIVTGHCYPTAFVLNPSGKTTWMARLAPEDEATFFGEEVHVIDGRKWVEVPDKQLVNRYKNPDPTGEAGHLCTNHAIGMILCARGPNLGG